MFKKMVALFFLFALADAQAISFNLFTFSKRKQITQEQKEKLEAEAQRQRDESVGGHLTKEDVFADLGDSKLADEKLAVNKSAGQPIESIDIKDKVDNKTKLEKTVGTDTDTDTDTDTVLEEKHDHLPKAFLIYFAIYLLTIQK